MDKEFLFKVAPAACEAVFALANKMSSEVGWAVVEGKPVEDGQFEDANMLLECAEANIKLMRRILRRHGISDSLETKLDGFLHYINIASMGMLMVGIKRDTDLKKEAPPAAPDSAAQEGK